MTLALFFLFIGLPLVELALLIKLGQAYGLWAVMGLIFLTALVGFFVLQTHGLTVMRKASAAVQRGETAFDALHDGAFVALAGILLIFPGVIGDALGFALLVPPLRRVIAGWSLKALGASVRVTTYSTGAPRQPAQPNHDPQGEPTGPSARPKASPTPRPGGPFATGPVIDGEYERIDEAPKSESKDKRHDPRR
jgi:UPF0716 protein FxsA